MYVGFIELYERGMARHTIFSSAAQMTSQLTIIFPVIRIQLILMRIRILDPQWKKIIQDISLKFTEFF